MLRLAVLGTLGAVGLIAACGNGDDDDSSAPKDAGAKQDVTSTTPPDSGGGSGPEAGTPADSGVVDAADASEAGTGPLSCAGYIYCEDFESYTDSGVIASGTKLGPWGTNIGGKTDAGQTMAMGVDTVKPFSGSYALHLTAPAGESTYGQLSRSTADAGDIGANMFGRAMVYFSDGPLPGGSAPLTDSGTYGLPSGVHSWIFDSSGHSPELDASVSANIIVGNPKLALNYSPGDYGPGASRDAGPVTTGTWHCLQWQYDGSGTTPADIMNVWFDGFNEVHTDPTLTYGNPAESLKMASDWTQLVFGFTHYQTTQIPQDVYLDDFAIDDQMVPCPSVSP
jgi:hypothetical protein